MSRFPESGRAVEAVVSRVFLSGRESLPYVIAAKTAPSTLRHSLEHRGRVSTRARGGVTKTVDFILEAVPAVGTRLNGAILA